jgi:hypothetical protein
MNDNTVIITRTLDAHEMERLKQSLRELWPGQDWTVLHGTMLRDVNDLRQAWGPSEFKSNVSMTPLPRWEQ